MTDDGIRGHGRSLTGAPMTSAEPPSRVHVEPWPAGGWAVWLEGHPVPVSRHDTEDEALSRAAAYRRGLKREQA